MTGQLHKLTYEAAKADMVAELPHEEQLFAQAMQEHMHLKHIHNAVPRHNSAAVNLAV